MIRMRVTVPKVNTPNLQQAIRTAATNLGKRVHKQYDDLTGQWNDPPQFDEKVNVRATRTIVEVKTLNNKYRWVDLGTSPHPIDPRPENTTGLLVFQAGYTPSTTPRSLKTRSSSRSGPTIFTPHVDHPGSEPRHFEVPIAKEQKPLVKDELIKLIKNNLKIGTETYDI